MLHVIKDLERLKIDTVNEDIGYVYDFYFDDVSWITRYIVVDTGNWLTGKKVLVSPYSIKKPNFLENKISTDLSKKQIKNSPDVSLEEPVSRQFEQMLSEYYGWPAYWSMDASMQAMAARYNSDDAKALKLGKDDPHLRSVREVRNYTINAIDGEIGVVDSFIIDDQNWIIKYLVIDTRKWLHWLPGGKDVLIAPEWIENIKWNRSTVNVALDKETIENGPEFTSAKEIDEKFENKLYNCYKEFVEKKIVDIDR
jgi:hypothetical protein